MEDNQKKWKMTSKKMKMENSIVRQSYWADVTTKTSKTNDFDTIEINLISYILESIKVFLEPKQTYKDFIIVLHFVHENFLQIEHRVYYSFKSFWTSLT